MVPEAQHAPRTPAAQDIAHDSTNTDQDRALDRALPKPTNQEEGLRPPQSPQTRFKRVAERLPTPAPATFRVTSAAAAPVARSSALRSPSGSSSSTTPRALAMSEPRPGVPRGDRQAWKGLKSDSGKISSRKHWDSKTHTLLFRKLDDILKRHPPNIGAKYVPERNRILGILLAEYGDRGTKGKFLAGRTLDAIVTRVATVIRQERIKGNSVPLAFNFMFPPTRGQSAPAPAPVSAAAGPSSSRSAAAAAAGSSAAPTTNSPLRRSQRNASSPIHRPHRRSEPARSNRPPPRTPFLLPPRPLPPDPQLDQRAQQTRARQAERNPFASSRDRSSNGVQTPEPTSLPLFRSSQDLGGASGGGGDSSAGPSASSRQQPARASKSTPEVKTEPW